MKPNNNQNNHKTTTKQAAQFLAQHALPAAGQVSLWLAKKAADQAAQVVVKLLRPPTSAGPPGGAPPRPKSNVFGLTPRPLRTLCKVTAAQLAASRVPVPDADALLEAAGPLPGSGDENSVRIVESLDQG